MTYHVCTVPMQLASPLAVRPEDIPAAVCAPTHEHALTCADVVEAAELLGIDFAVAPFSVEDLHLALQVELELGHECAPSMIDALDDDLVDLGMVAVAHLQEGTDYYAQLTHAHAPGDAPPPRHEHAGVGTD
jgi:hypothetical protein